MFRRPNKYRAVRTADGFPSKLEKAVYEYLKRREFLGEIRDIRRQVTVTLIDGLPNERIRWKVDFAFTDVATGKTIFAEAKGVETETYRLKLKLWRKLRPFTLEIYKGTYRKIFLAEKIVAD